VRGELLLTKYQYSQHFVRVNRQFRLEQLGGDIRCGCSPLLIIAETVIKIDTLPCILSAPPGDPIYYSTQRCVTPLSAEILAF
jgi:hypothetical protein